MDALETLPLIQVQYEGPALSPTFLAMCLGGRANRPGEDLLRHAVAHMQSSIHHFNHPIYRSPT
jgi:hypothetical protein